MTVSVSSPTLKARLFPTAKTASLLAALALVAQSEWALALAVGWPAWIAWAAPIALDAYILASISAKRDLGPSVVVSTASVFGSHAVYAAPGAWEGGIGRGHHLIWPLAAACSVVPLLVTWRVHHLHLPKVVAAPAATVLPVAPSVPVEVAVEQAPAPETPAAAPALGPRLVPPLVTNPNDQKILAALDGKALGQTALEEASGVKTSTLKNSVKRLIDQGHVVKVGTLYQRRDVA